MNIKNLFKKKRTLKKCALCEGKIPIGEEWTEAEFFSPTVCSPMYFHEYCWEKYNEKVKGKQKTHTLAEAQLLAFGRILFFKSTI